MRRVLHRLLRIANVRVFVCNLYLCLCLSSGVPTAHCFGDAVLLRMLVFGALFILFWVPPAVNRLTEAIQGFVVVEFSLSFLLNWTYSEGMFCSAAFIILEMWPFRLYRWAADRWRIRKSHSGAAHV